GVPRARAGALVLRPLGLPAPSRRLDAGARGAHPARSRLPAAVGRPALRLRGAGRRPVGDALLRPRRRTGLRPSLAARGGAPPVRRALLAAAAAVAALAVPAAAWSHATLKHEFPAFGQRLEAAPTIVRLSFDQYVKF